MLPNDPVILLSVINTKLRDNYESLVLLCDDLEVNENELVEKLRNIGYEYSEELNKFIWKSRALHGFFYIVNIPSSDSISISICSSAPVFALM